MSLHKLSVQDERVEGKVRRYKVKDNKKQSDRLWNLTRAISIFPCPSRKRGGGLMQKTSRLFGNGNAIGTGCREFVFTEAAALLLLLVGVGV
jgi:hypothetical protein